MGIHKFGWVLECLSLSSKSSSSLRINSIAKKKGESEKKPLIAIEKMKDGGSKVLVSQFKPKMVMLRVSMHCNGCARKVEKHITRMEGVSSCHVDLKTKLVTVIGDNIVPLQVLESVSRVKNAELLTTSYSQEANLSKTNKNSGTMYISSNAFRCTF